MENKIFEEVNLLGRIEVVISKYLLVLSLVMIISDLVFHLAGGFLAVIGMGVGLAAFLGVIAGIATLKLKYLGAVLNLILAGYIIFFELPVVKTVLSDIALKRTWEYTYPAWHFISAIILLFIAALLIFIFLRMILKSIFRSQ